MQPLFEISFITDRACFYELGEVMAKRHKGRKASCVLTIISAVLTLLTAMAAVETLPMLIMLVAFLVIFLACYGRVLGNAAYRASGRWVVDAPITFRFEEDAFYACAPLVSASYRYEIIQEIVESDKLILLFFGKGEVQVLQKSAFSPEALAEFRNFITRRTGRWITPVKIGRSGVRLASAIALVAAFCVACGFLGHWGATRPQTMEVGAYAITLPADFIRDEWTEYDLEAYNYDVGVQVYGYSEASMEEQLGAGASCEMVLRWIMSDTPGISSATYGKLENGDPYATYRWTSEEGIVWYYQSSVTQGDGFYWLTEMYCSEEGIAQYADSFLQWGSTVTVQELEHEYVW